MTTTTTASGRMPVLFAGHGSPMNAIEDNRWSRGFRGLAPMLGKPKAILAVSAHWFVRGTFVTDNAVPPTIHDFGGFPQELFEVEYPAPGSIPLALRVVALLGNDRVATRGDWGLDHGTWSVLRNVFPKANCPVVQLSIDVQASPVQHLAIGRALSPLRDEGILIVGSGNVTHNLRHALGNLGRGEISTPDWASRFDSDVAAALENHDHAFFEQALKTDDGRMSHPTPDHFLPLLYVVGAADSNDTFRTPISGFDLGSLSMRSVLFG